jgi:hypothetical protein
LEQLRQLYPWLEKNAARDTALGIFEVDRRVAWGTDAGPQFSHNV